MSTRAGRVTNSDQFEPLGSEEASQSILRAVIKMKFAFIFLSTFLVVSDQQFQPQRGLAWWSPYSQQSFFNNYQQPETYFHQHQQLPINNYQSPYYENQFYRHHYSPLIRTIDIPYTQNNELEQIETEVEENGFADTQSRIKGFGSNRPSFLNQRQNLSPRFFYSLLNGNSLANPLLKTVTFTSTTTVTLATVQSCLSSTLFVTGSSNISCRRKRGQHGNVEFPDVVSDLQFAAINPSATQQVTPTELASFIPLERNYRQLSVDEAVRYPNIISSKDEDALSEISESFHSGINSRSKRFFYFLRYVSTTTSTSYSFVSTTITKAVNLVSTAFGTSALICMPQGYVLCT